MAYPTVNGPYGLIPINLIGGQVFAGATRQIPIASNYGVGIFFGDVVKLSSDGILVKETGTTTATPVGVFLGCSYTDPTYGKVFRQNYPINTVASDIMAYVQDDPDALFKVAIVSSGTTIGTVQRTAVGNNAELVQNSGNTTTGNSAVAIDNIATTATLPIRIIDLVPETSYVSGGNVVYQEAIVKWNAPYVVSASTTTEPTPGTFATTTTSTVTGGHQYLNPVGV
jgi:hypothetical protein